MSEQVVKRYDIDSRGAHECDNGHWIHAANYDALQSLNAELLEALEVCKGALEWAIEQGGGPACEHEVGVCFCREIEALHSAIAAIAKARSQS